MSKNVLVARYQVLRDLDVAKGRQMVNVGRVTHEEFLELYKGNDGKNRIKTLITDTADMLAKDGMDKNLGKQCLTAFYAAKFCPQVESLTANQLISLFPLFKSEDQGSKWVPKIPAIADVLKDLVKKYRPHLKDANDNVVVHEGKPVIDVESAWKIADMKKHVKNLLDDAAAKSLPAEIADADKKIKDYTKAEKDAIGRRSKMFDTIADLKDGPKEYAEEADKFGGTTFVRGLFHALLAKWITTADVNELTGVQRMVNDRLTLAGMEQAATTPVQEDVVETVGPRADITPVQAETLAITNEG